MEIRQSERDFLNMIAEQKQVIYKICYMYAKNQNERNDLSQEVILNLWKSFPNYKAIGKPSTWVYRVAMNTCITYLRHSNTRPKTTPLTHDVSGIIDEGNIKAEQLQELYHLINQLGKMERALVLLWLEELNYQEIGAILGISKNNVAVKLHRVKEKLKKISNC